MIRAILKKDWLLLWPLVTLVTAIQAGLEWSQYSAGLFQESAVAAELQRPLTLAWFLAIAALTVIAVQQDALPGVDQDWLIRPIKRRELLCAKMLFVLLSVSAPMFLLNLGHVLLMGFSWQAALPVLAFKELYVFAVLLLPLMALAAATRSLSELAWLGAAMMVMYALGVGLSAVLLGAVRCPTCDSGLSWQSHLLQHAGVLCGSAWLLYWQYRRRATRAALAIALSGALLLAFTQMPWSWAFSLQRSLTPATPADAAPLSLTVVPQAADSRVPPAALGRSGVPVTRAAAAALWHGNVDAAADSVRRRLRGERLADWDAEIRVEGMSPEQWLLIDRTEVTVQNADDQVAFRGADTRQPLAVVGRTDSGEAVSMRRSLPLPPIAWQGARPDYARLKVTFWLTRMRLIGSYRMAAVDGAVRSELLGVCESRLGSGIILVRCQQIGRTPFCINAGLFDPDGAAGPAAQECSPDYRPYPPVFANSVSYAGLDVPLRGPWDAAALSRLQLKLDVYAELDHSSRILQMPNWP